MVLARLASAIASLAGQLPGGLRMPVSEERCARACLNQRQFEAVAAAFAEQGLEPPVPIGPLEPMSLFDGVVTEFILHTINTHGSDPLSYHEAGSLHGVRQTFRSHEGLLLSFLRFGDASGRRFLFLGAPGLPAELSARWLVGLSRQGEVAFPETRGLFGNGAARVEDLSAAAQVEDAVSLMRSLGWTSADVVGVCGGAALALGFASAHPEMLETLSLWFGDYELGTCAPKTEHQRNLKSLMELVVTGQALPQDVLSILLSVLCRQATADIAPFVLYPFANAGLFARYCRANHSVMSMNCSEMAGDLGAPCLVGYSYTDQTTHPDGSRYVARMLHADVEGIDDLSHLQGVKGRPQDIARTCMHAQAVRAVQ